MKVMIVATNHEYNSLFYNQGWEVVEDISDSPSLILFTGGEDVSPKLYEHPQHRTTYNSIHRDYEESRIFKEAISLGIPMVGICRGGQFLNVMCGGTMYQDVSKHATRDGHLIKDLFTNQKLNVTSTHHQMMKPSNKAIVVAIANNGGVVTEWDGKEFNTHPSELDYEVVYYEDEKCLCFQPHPEFSSNKEDEMVIYFFSLIQDLLF